MPPVTFDTLTYPVWDTTQVLGGLVMDLLYFSGRMASVGFFFSSEGLSLGVPFHPLVTIWIASLGKA